MVPQYSLNLSQIKQEIDNKSGYPFELDIVRRIETDHDYTYFVEPNYSFEDQDTGKARELDFHAIQAIPISTKRSEYIFVVILGSCKDSKNPYVFFTREMPLPGITLNLDVPIAGYPLEIYIENDEKEDILWYFRLDELLHTIETDIISSQFCEIIKKSGGWNIGSETLLNDVLVPLIKVLSKEIEEYNEEHRPDPNEIVPDYQIYYPLLILKGPMLEYHITPEGSTELKETKHVVVVRHYESKTVKGRFAIDVIHESYLKQYLELIERETNKLVNRIRRHKSAILNSITKIIEQNQDTTDKAE